MASAEYQRSRYERMPPALCHPERKEHCKRLCRQCYNAGVEAPKATCHPTKPRAGGGGLCRQCYANLPHVKTRAVMVRRLRKYNLPEDRYLAMLAEQGGLCAICRGRVPGAIDHDHKTGLVRGLLCRPCNSGIGHMGEDVTALAAAIAYLKRTAANE